MSKSKVYCVGFRGGFVKIGFSSDVETRIKTLRRDHSFDLQLIATIDGGAKEESEIHQLFSHSRITGEWFSDHMQVISIWFCSQGIENVPAEFECWRDALKMKIKDQGISQKELARRMGVTEGSVSHYITGRRTPSVGDFIKIADQLGVPVSSLI